MRLKCLFWNVDYKLYRHLSCLLLLRPNSAAALGPFCFTASYPRNKRFLRLNFHPLRSPDKPPSSGGSGSSTEDHQRGTIPISSAQCWSGLSAHKIIAVTIRIRIRIERVLSLNKVCVCALRCPEVVEQLGSVEVICG